MAFVETKPLNDYSATTTGAIYNVYGQPGLYQLSTAGGGSTGGVRIWCGSGDDSVYGTNSNDTIVGGAGNDYLRGNGGSDQLYGGTGSDTFVYKGNSILDISNPNAADWLSSNGDMIMDFQGAGNGSYSNSDNDTILFIGYGTDATLTFDSNWAALPRVQFYKITAGTTSHGANADVAGKVFWLAITLADSSDTVIQTASSTHLVAGDYYFY